MNVEIQLSKSFNPFKNIPPFYCHKFPVQKRYASNKLNDQEKEDFYNTKFIKAQFIKFIKSKGTRLYKNCLFSYLPVQFTRKVLFLVILHLLKNKTSSVSIKYKILVAFVSISTNLFDSMARRDHSPASSILCLLNFFKGLEQQDLSLKAICCNFCFNFCYFSIKNLLLVFILRLPNKVIFF